MNGKKEEQREFFEEFKEPEQHRDRLRKRYIPSKRFFVTVSLENLVLFCIIVIMVIVLSFSLGVERGKRFDIAKETVIEKEAAPALRAEVSAIEKELPARLKAGGPARLKAGGPARLKAGGPARLKAGGPAPTAAAKYTIQVATFRKESAVDEEIKRLKKNGFSAFTVPSKDMFQVRVGKYATLEEAKSDLRKLRERYKDCFVRDIK